MVKFIIAVSCLFWSVSSLANPISVKFTQDFGDNGFVTGSFTGEDVDLDGQIIYDKFVPGLDTVTAYSVQFTPGSANSGDISSFSLGLELLDQLNYTIGSTVVVVVGGEGPPLEHFYNCSNESSCFVGDVDNLYSSGGANRAELLPFNDVPADYWAFSFIKVLGNNRITSGCGGGNYCPEDSVTRAQMAVFLERGMRGGDFNPPAAVGNVFMDIGATDFAASFIEQLFADGITAGCGNENYCPDTTVTRDQMAVFLLRAKYGASYSPPAAGGTFGDVPVNHWAAAWIEQLAAEGVTAGCGGGNYCPNAPVTRAQMAVFMSRTFDLKLIFTMQESYDDLRQKFLDFRQNVVFPQMLPGSWIDTSLANIDLDGDGDLDVVVGVALGENTQTQEREVGEVYLFRNNGIHGFVMEATGILGTARSFVIGDFNNDGLEDVYIAEHGYDLDPFPGHTDYLFLQTMGGDLIDATTTNLPPIKDFAHGSCASDIDNNGGLDVMTANGGSFKLMVNDGTAVFTDVNATQLPIPEISSDYIWENNLQDDIPLDEHPNLNFGFWWCAKIDVDVDTDADIILGGANSDGKRLINGDDIANKHVILFNDGIGNFSYDSLTSRVASTEVPAGQVTGMWEDDFNNDGCADFVSTATDYETVQDTNFFLNDCFGNFSILYSNRITIIGDQNEEWFWIFEKEDLDENGVPEYILAGESLNRNVVFEKLQGVFETRNVTVDDLYNLSPATFLRIEQTVPR